jgi:hypothetical protein
MSNDNGYLVEVKDLKEHFPVRTGFFEKTMNRKDSQEAALPGTFRLL